MPKMSRRRALQLVGLGAAGLAAGGAGLAWADMKTPDQAGPATLLQPDIISSRRGSLDVRLEAGMGTGLLAGRSATTLRYNGGVPGPTLHLMPGDHLGIDLVNGLDEPTNLHTHGLQVSPNGNSDNPFVVVQPGETFHYDYRIPTDHPTGTFWYHPHHHGMVADQVYGGLYGAIIIGDTVPADTERVLVISDLTLDGDGTVPPVSAMQRRFGREGELVLINGQLRPELTAVAGTRERWRIVNACVSRYLHLRLDGQDLLLLGIDLPLEEPYDVTQVLLAPGNRADLLVDIRPGSSTLQAVPYDRVAPGMGMPGMGSGGMGSGGMGSGGMGSGGMGSGGMGSGGMGGGGMGGASAHPAPIDLAVLTVTGDAPPSGEPAPAPTSPRVPRIRGADVVERRTLTLAMGMDMAESSPFSFTIDDRHFDPDRVDQRAARGAVEEWTIINTSEMDHPFHLHVWPMQVVRIDGTHVESPTWQDVVTVPARSSTVVRIRFDRYAGRTVYHCHVLDHEDLGMMGVLQVG
ncbi:multicopper oxidase family protein [Nakamurella sp. GG22]